MHCLDPVLHKTHQDLSKMLAVWSEFDAAGLVASSRLGRAGISKQQVTDERSNSNSKHNPAIVCHEQQPVNISNPSCLSDATSADSHNEERIEHLHSIQRSLDKLRLLLRVASSISP